MYSFDDVVQRLHSVWRQARKLSITFQPELRGHYSSERLRKLFIYSQTTPLSWTIVIILAPPFPCLIILISIDAVALAAPRDGISANYLWIRDFVTIALMTRVILEQFRVTVPELHISATQLAVMPIISSGGAVVFMIAMAGAIGFPLPFSLVLGINVWFLVLVACFVGFFGRVLRQNRALLRELIKAIVVLICQVLLTFIYPAYLYGFISVSARNQKYYVMLLPVIKVAARNWISYCLGDNYDLIPQAMIFNVDLFNALYVSSSMENSHSSTTVVQMVALDILLGCVSLSDIKNLCSTIIFLRQKIPADHPFKTATFMEIALEIIDEDPRARSRLSGLRYGPSLTSFDVLNVKNFGALMQVDIPATQKIRILPVAPPRDSIDTAEPVKRTMSLEQIPTRTPLTRIFSNKERQWFLERSARTLFTTEFVILVLYTKVIIPLIYCIYTAGMFLLANRDYYPLLQSFDASELVNNLGRVIAFGFIELGLMLVMGYLIQRVLGISVIQLLSFVLDRSWQMVQSNLFLWICYTIQNSLEHNAHVCAAGAAASAQRRPAGALGPLLSSYLGPPPTLSLSAACAFGSLRLLDWIWANSAQSADTRSPTWTLNNYLRSEREYYLWQFRKSTEVAAARGDVEMVKWLFDHFSDCFVPVDVVEVAAKNGHLPILDFLLENDAGRYYKHSHTAMAVPDGIVPYQSVPEIPEQEKGDGIVVHWGGRSMLHAIVQGHVEIARWLKENSPHQMDNDEVRWAVEYSLRVPDMNLALFFLPKGRSIVEFAHDDPYPETVEKLLEEGYTRQDEHCAAVSIYMLARVGRLDLMQRIVQLHSPPRRRSRFDWSSEWFFATKEACKFGDLSVVRWLMEHPIGKRVAEAYEHQHSAGPEHFFALAAAGGHIEVMEYLDNEGYSDNFKDAAILAIRNNHLEALKWLLRNHSYYSDTFMVEEAARCGRLNLLQFLHHADDSKDDVSILSWFRNAIDVATGKGHLAVVQWLHENRSDGCTTRAMNNAARNGHLEVVKWLHQNRSEGCTTRAMDKAASNGHLDVVQWLHTNRSEGCTKKAMDLAAANGHLKVVQWLYANRKERCSAKAFEKALENSHLSVAWWLHGRMPSWNPSVDTLQIQSPNQFDILLFLDEHFPKLYDAGDPTQPLLGFVIEPNDRHTVKWIWEKHSIIIDVP